MPEVEAFISPGYLKNALENAHSVSQNFELPLITGASNAWAVHGSLTQEKKSIVCNDPHLAHSARSNFYLASLEGGSVFATGASLVGVPSF